jgi:hypothetical protein
LMAKQRGMRGYYIHCCRKHRGLIAIELSCSWVPVMVYALILVYVKERERWCEDAGGVDFSPASNLG